MPVTFPKKGSILLINGLDTSMPAEYIGEQSSPNVRNFRIDRALLTKRYGTSAKGDAIGGTDTEIMRGVEFTREGTKYNIRIGRDKIERYNAGTSAWVDITGTDLTGSADDIVSTAVPLLSGKRILCITNGIDAIRKWTATGNTAALGGSPPVPKFIQEYKTYLVCANIQGGTDISQRVQWSDTADPETWSGGNSGAVDLTDDGEDITGLSIFGNYLSVHNKRAIYLGYLVSSSAIFRFDRKATGRGTVSNSSIVNLPDGTQMFLAEDGLCVFNGVSAPSIASKANDEIRDQLNLSAKHKAWGVFVPTEDEAWFGIPLGSETTPTTVYKYNYKTGVIHKDTYAEASAAWLATQSSGETWDDDDETWDSDTTRWDDGQQGDEAQKIHFGNTSGEVVIVDTTTNNDSGSAIEAVWESKDFELDDVGRLARWQEILVWARGSGSLHAEYSTDAGDTWTEYSSSPFTLSAAFPTDTSPLKGYIDVLSTKLRVRFRVDGVNESLAIKQFTLGYVPREFI